MNIMGYEVFSLNKERGKTSSSLSERLSDIAPDIGPQSLRAVAVTANGMDYVNFDSVRMEKVAGGDSMMKAVHNLELCPNMSNSQPYAANKASG